MLPNTLPPVDEFCRSRGLSDSTRVRFYAFVEKECGEILNLTGEALVDVVTDPNIMSQRILGEKWQRFVPELKRQLEKEK